jgi:hypothetical protein
VAALAAAPLLAPSQAAAQFVCSDTQTGTGQGATAGPNSVACGTGAIAGGDGTVSNTATGVNANASGSGNAPNGVGNTATGNLATASGNFSTNTATGSLANASGNDSENVVPAAVRRTFYLSLHHSWLLENLALDHLAERRETACRVGDHGACFARSFRRQLLDRPAQAGDGAIRGTGFECWGHG